MANYQPPEQSRRSQLIDAVTILVLIFATLFATTYLVEESSASATSADDSSRPVANLPVNSVERAQYERLIASETTDLASVNSAVDGTQDPTNKYQINIWALLGTAVLLALYLGFVYRTSFREYREVIEERFGARDERELS